MTDAGGYETSILVTKLTDHGNRVTMIGVTNAPNITYRKTIVEPAEAGFLLMDEDGAVTYKPSAIAVVRFITKRDRASLKTGVSTVTLIEWRNVPDGFVPPGSKP